MNGLFSTFSGIYSGQRGTKKTQNATSTAGKRWCFFLLLLLASPVHALDLELGLGKSQYLKRKDGCWYDSRFPYEEERPKYNLSIGVTGKLSSNIEWKVSYVDLGKFRIDAIGLSDDREDLYPERKSTSIFITKGHVKGFSAIVRPGMDILGIRVFAEVGAFIFRPDFHVYMPNHPYGYLEDGTPYGSNDIKARHEAPLQLTPTIGFGFGDKRRRITFSYINLDQRYRTDQYVTSYKSAYTANVNLRF